MAREEPRVLVSQVQVQIQVKGIDVEMKEEGNNPEMGGLDIGEINVEMEDESPAEWVKQLIFESIIHKVFQFIDEKKAILQNRKTWTLKRQEEQLQQVKKKRQEWKLEESNVKTKLRALLGEQRDPSLQLQVPVTLALEQSVVHAVMLQNKLVNKCLLHYAHRHIGIVSHMEALKQVMLCGQGDVVSQWLDSVFHNDWLQTAKDSSVAYLNGQLDLAIGGKAAGGNTT